MEQQGKTCIEFDYTSFLGATGSKKWTFLEHKGPVFAPLYERVPKNVRFYYESKYKVCVCGGGGR